MKLSVSAKPISSPGRSEKFPPPLMRFLRSSVGSRSRGRSRASPMFFRKAMKGSSSSVAAESTQEPSSPKVTCMGQVRVGRSKKKGQPRRPRRAGEDDRPGSSTRCTWFSRSLLCNCPGGRRWRRSRSRSRSNSRGWLRRVSLPCVGSDCSSFFPLVGRRRRRPKISKKDPPTSKEEMEQKFRNRSLSIESRGRHGGSELKGEEEEDDEEEMVEAGAYVASSSPCSPPKNALLLTRCRSAPYRSSSLACRFWSSPLNGAGEAHRPPLNEKESSAFGEPKMLLASEGESRVHPEEEEEKEKDDDDEEGQFLEETTDPAVAERMVKPTKIEELKTTEEEEEEGSMPLPRLTRCKSEPARTASQKVGVR
ncbi:hypothetical protein SAY87_027987 [Trapa incisa]|uniref:Uncharacterized protein n=1 Tax=Trapa incisa TaxID=236973 RepID=A0AAN7QR77_9MYRT|nr:hypothetical protein SAY87_027987 [Trapa incisa]